MCVIVCVCVYFHRVFACLCHRVRGRHSVCVTVCLTLWMFICHCVVLIASRSLHVSNCMYVIVCVFHCVFLCVILLCFSLWVFLVQLYVCYCESMTVCLLSFSCHCGSNCVCLRLVQFYICWCIFLYISFKLHMYLHSCKFVDTVNIYSHIMIYN